MLRRKNPAGHSRAETGTGGLAAHSVSVSIVVSAVENVTDGWLVGLHFSGPFGLDRDPALQQFVLHARMLHRHGIPRHRHRRPCRALGGP